MDKQHLKKDGEELQQYLLFRRRGQRVEAKKAKVLYISVLVKKIRRVSNLRNDNIGATKFAR